jgi:decaprenyl-phosphate phosphoribosyltransferase
MSILREERDWRAGGADGRAGSLVAGRLVLVRPRTHFRHYLALMRLDHWPKNAFMLLGLLLAVFYRPETFALASIPPVLVAILATCLVASSNYVLNEWLDAPLDRLHPRRKHRPAAMGLVKGNLAYMQWLGLGAVGLALAFTLNFSFGLAATGLWVAGCAYNIPPLRTKDVPYLDVVSESFNNPLRLLLGWYVLVPDHIPPVSLILAYWMLGAFLMAAKRLGEVRQMEDPALLATYRPVFKTYDEPRLLGSMVFYVTLGALFAGIFVVRYKLELILCVPLLAGFFMRYMQLALAPESPVQTPEKLWRVPGFCSYALICLLAFTGLMFVEIPFLYELFRVEPSGLLPLWRIGP